MAFGGLNTARGTLSNEYSFDAVSPPQNDACTGGFFLVPGEPGAATAAVVLASAFSAVGDAVGAVASSHLTRVKSMVTQLCRSPSVNLKPPT